MDDKPSAAAQFTDTDILNWLSSQDDYWIYRGESGLHVIYKPQSNEERRVDFDTPSLREMCVRRMTELGWSR